MRRFVVGIDLGTTNTVVAYAEAGRNEIRLFEIEQLVAPGEVAARPLLPSARFHPASGQLPDHDLRLPWPMTDLARLRQVVIGSLARDLGAQVPGRLVASAKSWLSHPSVDRLAEILPWGANEEVGKVSPVVASASYLAYVRAAWNARYPRHLLEQQDVVLTVPASFDEAARALTVKAARLASLPGVRLLEEPQAAFYDWLHRHRNSLDEELAQTRLVLVCDVGGGTTDLTLIRVESGVSGPRFTRIGVGDHLMLGGDNMDLALAHRVEGRVAGANARLSATRLSQLVQQCRAVKERLLAADAPASAAVTLLGAGAQVIGGARTVELPREEVEAIVVDGFLPRVAPEERPARLRGGIVEFGLPYAADAAITRHVAAFLGQHAHASSEALGIASSDPTGLPVPDTLLLNGGVFRASALARRLEDVLGAWRGAPLAVLHNEDPDVAVARGAVAYALAREGHGPRIGGGSPRSYFLVLEDDRQARRGVCLLPRGTEETQEIRLAGRTFALRIGQPVSFHLVSTVGDATHEPGELADLSLGDFVRLPPVATVVDAKGAKAGSEIAVQLVTELTEVGTLEVECVSADDVSRRWQLEFELRGEGDSSSAGSTRVHRRLPAAVDKIDRVYGSRSRDVDAREVKQLRLELERLLGERETWDTSLLRELFGALWKGAGRRRRSADHERLWLNLTGYCLRPGFGYPLDEWRIEQLWSIFEQGIQYGKENQIWSEWWTLWRRVAGGLPEAAQARLIDEVAVHLQPAAAARAQRAAGSVKHGYEDMVRLVASLERVPAELKVEVGDWLLERLQKPEETPQSWWAVGRLGAREPFYGSAHNVVPSEVAARWLTMMLALDWHRIEPARFAATQIARMTGDRTRDLAPELRENVARRLETSGAPRSWITLVREVVKLDEADERRVFGESLPPGLKLLQ